jgi:hypothetical protein
MTVKKKVGIPALEEMKVELSNGPSKPWPDVPCHTMKEMKILWDWFWERFLKVRVSNRFSLKEVEGPLRIPDIGEFPRLRPGFMAGGIYWYCKLNNPLPKHPKGPLIRIVDQPYFRWRVGKEQFEQVIHSSNLYSLNDTMQHGLQHGVATKANLKGVYCYDGTNPKYMQSSTGYRVYSSFDQSTYVWAVFYELAFNKAMTHKLGKMMAGCGQIAAKKGSFHMIGMYIHAIHLAEIEKYVQQGLQISADVFHPEYEISHAAGV